MTRPNAVLWTALAAATGVGVASFLYYLWAFGIPVAGLLTALGLAVFIASVTVVATAVILGSKG